MAIALQLTSTARSTCHHESKRKELLEESLEFWTACLACNFVEPIKDEEDLGWIDLDFLFPLLSDFRKREWLDDFSIGSLNRVRKDLHV